MYYENEFKCFEEFAVVIDEYIDHYNNQRIQENKTDISCKIQGNIHMYCLVHK